MSRAKSRAVEAARRRLEASSYQDPEAWTALHQTERELAESRGEPWAERLDLGVSWDAGAPLPHLVSGRSKAVLLCFESVDDPNWDGTYVRVVEPSAPEPVQLIRFTFEECTAIKLGAPNDEALHGHPLHSRGLEGYGPHVVHDSPWISELEQINSIHPDHRGEWDERMQHYFFVFHDEMFEALAREVRVDHLHGILADELALASRSITHGD